MILTLTSGTLKQSTFDKVGADLSHDTIFLTKGTYTAESPYELNPGTTITGDTAIIKLISNAPTSDFSQLVPIFHCTGSNFLFENITFDGNKDNQKVGHGKGYHNFIGANKASNITIKNLTMRNSQGDGARLTDSKNILFENNNLTKLGHDGLYVDRCTDVTASNNTIYTRANSGLRCKGSHAVTFKDNTIYGTSEAYAPGMQIENSKADETSSNILIENNSIQDTLGPGIWVAGHTATDLKAASNLIIRNNTIINCGLMPKENHISGVGGIVADGFNLTLEGNKIENCKGYGILFGKYLTSSANTGYIALLKNNSIKNTQKNNVGTGGIDIFNEGKYVLSYDEAKQSYIVVGCSEGESEEMRTKVKEVTDNEVSILKKVNL